MHTDFNIDFHFYILISKSLTPFADTFVGDPQGHYLSLHHDKLLIKQLYFQKFIIKFNNFTVKYFFFIS